MKSTYFLFLALFILVNSSFTKYVNSQATTNVIKQSSCSCGIRGRANGRSNEASSNITRIVGGQAAGKNEFPWRCFLLAANLGAFCGATLISENWVLTAAHCTSAVPKGDDLFVVCGVHDINAEDQQEHVDSRVIQVIQHEKYAGSPTHDNDISLLKLEKPFQSTQSVSPICLPWNTVGRTFTGQSVTASGWGTTSYMGPRATILQKVDLPIISTNMCWLLYPFQITPNHICTYRRGFDTCQGDSGGSVDYRDPSSGRYSALGIVSWGDKCAAKKRPGVYTLVSKYLEWIRIKTRENFCR